jgi:hypothetical protein
MKTKWIALSLGLGLLAAFTFPRIEPLPKRNGFLSLMEKPLLDGKNMEEER